MVKTKPESEEAFDLTAGEVEKLLLQIRGGKLDGSDDSTDETVGAFLLLLQFMAYADMPTRENCLRAAERVMLTYTFAFQEGANRLREAWLDSLHGVKRVEVELKPRAKKK